MENEFLLECNDFAIGMRFLSTPTIFIALTMQTLPISINACLYLKLLLSHSKQLKGVLMLKLKGFMTAVQNMALQKIDEYL